jgi:hypothetical protein
MRIDTTKPRLPIDRVDRLKFPVKSAENEPDESQDLLLGDKEGEELERVVKKLYEQKIKK